MSLSPQFVLASASPRRTEILQGLGLAFEVRAQHIDESPVVGESVRDYVRRLAREKAHSAATMTTLPALGADTVVVMDGQALGKPADAEDARRMLQMLSGREHEVMTAVAVVQGERVAQALSTTRVVFREITTTEIEAYWQSAEPQDKAGGYAIQGLGAVFVASISGSYSGVVGLPVFETTQLLSRFGIEVLAQA